MLLAAGFVPSLVSLSALKSRALHRGAWFRVSPAARTLIDAALLYLRRGGRISRRPSSKPLVAPLGRCSA